MSYARGLKIAALLFAWLPLVWFRFPGAEDPGELPVQAQLQTVLAGRMVRVADLGGPELPEDVRKLLRREAGTLLDEGLEHRPDSEWLVTRKAILLAHAGDREAAVRLLSASKAPNPTPLVAALRRLYSGRPVKPGALEASDLRGYYRYLALAEAAGGVPPPVALQEEAQAVRDLRILQALVALTVGNAGLGLLALLAWPLYHRRLAGPNPAFSARWSPLGALACAVGFQWLTAMVAVPMSLVLSALQVPMVAMVVTVQLTLYLLAFGLLLRIVPRLAEPHEAGPRALLGLARPRGRDLALGVIGFWMAVPTVFVASWATSRLLGRVPFSSNDALELLTTASPLELGVMALLVAVAAPFFEEVLFRGVLFAGLRGALRPLGAGAVSALMFALVHGDPQAILVLSALGALFAFLYERSGSLWPAVIAHALWNGTTTLVVTLILMQ